MASVIEKELLKDQVLIVQGDEHTNLYLVQEGKFLACVSDGNKVTALSYISADEYIGEMSFFDQQPRSAHIICVEDAKVLQIPVTEIESQMPSWMGLLAKSMTKKIRLLNEQIKTKGIRKHSANTVETLSPQEQGHYFKILEAYKEECGLE